MWQCVAIMLVVSALIIVIQYPVLTLFKHWAYKLLVFYLSMNLFLFAIGIIWASHNEGSDWNLHVLIDRGIKMMFIGQVFGGLLMYLVVVIVNWKLRQDLFD
ncbi:MAG: hypothetical protein RL660_2705 [Bacteroidota bacterium]